MDGALHRRVTPPKATGIDHSLVACAGFFMTSAKRGGRAKERNAARRANTQAKAKVAPSTLAPPKTTSVGQTLPVLSDDAPKAMDAEAAVLRKLDESDARGVEEERARQEREASKAKSRQKRLEKKEARAKDKGGAGDSTAAAEIAAAARASHVGSTAPGGPAGQHTDHSLTDHLERSSVELVMIHAWALQKRVRLCDPFNRIIPSRAVATLPLALPPALPVPARAYNGPSPPTPALPPASPRDVGCSTELRRSRGSMCSPVREPSPPPMLLGYRCWQRRCTRPSPPSLPTYRVPTCRSRYTRRSRARCALR